MAMFVGGPLDGQSFSAEQVNQLASIIPIPTESGNRVFLFMPSLEGCEAILRGEQSKQFGAAPNCYERIFLPSGGAEYRHNPQGVADARREQQAPLSQEAEERKALFALRADILKNRVEEATILPTTFVYLIYIGTDANGERVRLRHLLTAETSVTFPGHREEAKQLALQNLRLSILASVDSLVRGARTGMIGLKGYPGISFRIEDFDLEIEDV